MFLYLFMCMARISKFELIIGTHVLNNHIILLFVIQKKNKLQTLLYTICEKNNLIYIDRSFYLIKNKKKYVTFIRGVHKRGQR